MRLSRWLMLIGLIAALGCLRVAQRTQVFLQGYALGSLEGRLHTQEVALEWLTARVEGLRAPMRLVDQPTTQPLVRVAALEPEPSGAPQPMGD